MHEQYIHAYYEVSDPTTDIYLRDGKWTRAF